VPDAPVFRALPVSGARKRFGQHFLVDPYVLDELVECIAPRTAEAIVEIGPGHGALTFRLLEKGALVDAIELDRDLASELARYAQTDSRLTIHQADALDFDFARLAVAGQLRVVGNLPYNISTPLILRLLRRIGLIEDMCFMVQKEVAERMTAAPGNGSYGRLAVLTQAFSETAIVMEVPPDAFSPPPKVDSSVVYLRPRQPGCEFPALERVVSQAFTHRRKMLRHTLGQRFAAERLAEFDISLTDRPENVTLAQFVALAKLADEG